MAWSLAPSDGLDADGVRAYRLALAREARRYKRYPREAIDAGWQGTVEVLVAVAAGIFVAVLAIWEMPPPSARVERVIPNDRLPR